MQIAINFVPILTEQIGLISNQFNFSVIRGAWGCVLVQQSTKSKQHAAYIVFLGHSEKGNNKVLA